MRNRIGYGLMLATFPLALSLGGCPITINTGGGGGGGGQASVVAGKINGAVGTVQTQDPRLVALPPALTAQGDAVVIDPSARFLGNVQQQVIIADLPADVIIGFENVTSFDAYYTFLVDGIFQGVFVFQGETLLFQYFCPQDIQLLTEDYFDPFTGIQVDAFDLDNAFFENPFDFQCGDAFIVTFDDFSVSVTVQAIQLL